MQFVVLDYDPYIHVPLKSFNLLIFLNEVNAVSATTFLKLVQAIHDLAFLNRVHEKPFTVIKHTDTCKLDTIFIWISKHHQRILYLDQQLLKTGLCCHLPTLRMYILTDGSVLFGS